MDLWWQCCQSFIKQSEKKYAGTVFAPPPPPLSAQCPLNRSDQSDRETPPHLQHDKIYQGDHLAIIVSAGEDPNHGLPGLQHAPRCRQLHLKAGPHTFASMENIRQQISESTWNSCGWTYQEMVISRRRLVFTESQVYVQC